MNKCKNCIEWEYFEGYGYGCFYKQTMTPIDADKCDSFVDKKVDFSSLKYKKDEKISGKESIEEKYNI